MEILPPWFETVWVGPDLTEVSEGEILKLMSARFSKLLGDQRLGRDNWERVNSVFPGIDWQTWFREASIKGEQIVSARGDVSRRLTAAIERLELVADGRIGVLRGRRGHTQDTDAMIAWEERSRDELHVAIERPRLLLDSVGLVVLAGFPLPPNA